METKAFLFDPIPTLRLTKVTPFLGMSEYEDVLSRIQRSIPSFTANYRCQNCVNNGGLPTEDELAAIKEERNRIR